MESQDPDTQSTNPQTQPTSQPHNSALDGHLWGFLQPCSASLTRIDFWKMCPSYAIGRNRDSNDVVLPGFKISNKHCRITWDGSDDRTSAVTVLDSSSNGTFINGVRIGKGITKLLREGNEIAFGSFHPQPQNSGIEDYRFVYRHCAGGPPDHGLYAHYDISTELGKGSFATVMKAISRATGQWYAVKMIHKDRLTRSDPSNPGASKAAQLSREISILEELKHPNICQLKEVFYHDGDINLVLELVDGGDLLDYILQRSGLNEGETRHITYQICDALSYIHGKGIAHRDLKPENVLLTKDRPPIVKVADFGLAKVVDSLTMLRTMCGTPSYLAPEVVMQTNRQGYDDAVDSWSVGVIVFAMLTSTSPFIEDDTQRDLRARIAGRVVDWSTLTKTTVSVNCQSFIRRLLEIQPTTRMSLTDALKHPWLTAYIPVYPHHHSPSRARCHDLSTDHAIIPDLPDGSDISIITPDMTGDAGVSHGFQHLKIGQTNSGVSAQDSTAEIVSSIPGAFPNGLSPGSGMRRELSRTTPLQRRSFVLSQAAEADASSVVPEPSWEMIQSANADIQAGDDMLGFNEVKQRNKRVHAELTPLPEEGDSSDDSPVNVPEARKKGKTSDEDMPSGAGRSAGKGRTKGKGATGAGAISLSMATRSKRSTSGGQKEDGDAMSEDEASPVSPSTSRPRRSTRQTPQKAARRG